MIALYRALLRLYPAAFRAEYGDELCTVFADRLRDTSRGRALIEALRDVIPNAVGVHFDILRQDLRYAARTLRRASGFAFTAIVVVALGVGANTAAFSLADFVLIRPLPYPNADRLVLLWSANQEGVQNETPPVIYRDWKAMATSSFSGMAAYVPSTANLVGQGPPRRLDVARVTPELMPLIGVPALAGSGITPVNSAAGGTAVLSHDLWRSHFGGDPAVLGKAVRLDGAVHTIIGIMPPAYHFPSRQTELWTSMLFAPEDFEDRTNWYLKVVGRLRPDATLEKARAEMAAVTGRIKQQHPEDDPSVKAWIQPLRDQIGRRQRVLVLALCGAALCILLLACANLASLLLARGVNRARELSIRTALGAGRDRLVRQFITESVLLSLIGGVIGVAIARAGLPLLARLVPTNLPIDEVPTLDLRVLAFAFVLMALTGLMFGLVPALRRPDNPRRWLRSALVVVEVTGALALLISSGLLMRAIWRIQAVEPGFRAEEVMTMRTALPLPKYGTVAARQRFYSGVVDQVRAIPGVKSAAYTTGLPMVRTGSIWPVLIEGRDDDDNMASVRYVTPGYFATLGIPLLRGRDFAETDTQDRKPYVAVISESAARRHWLNQDPIGRRFKIALDERVVIGVVGDVKVRGLERANEPQVYLAAPQVADNSIIGYLPQDLAIRSTLPAAQLLPSVRRIISSIDPEQPISDIRPLSEVVAGETAPRRVQLRVLIILSAIALLIAGVGIHGLLSFAVSQRTRELGIRRALGAPTAAIVGMVMWDALRLTLAGIFIGVAAAFAAGRAMRSLLFGVPPADLQTILAAVALCVITALIGTLRPTVHAVRVDPTVALREG